MSSRIKDVMLPNVRKQKTFKIRSKKTFSLEQNLKNSKTLYKKEGSRFSFSSFLDDRRWSATKVRRKSSIMLTTYDLRVIEDEIKSKILEIRRGCLWEIRNLNNLKEENNIQENNTTQNDDDDKIKPMIRFATKYLNNSNSDSNSNNSEKMKSNIYDSIEIKEIKKKIRRNQTFSKKKFVKKIIDTDKNAQKNMQEINKNINDNNNNNNVENKIIRRSKTTLKKKKTLKSKKTMADKFRFFCHRNLIIDSHDEDESDEDYDLEGYYINPDTNFILIFDFFIALSAIYSLIIFPCELMKSFCICENNNNIYSKIINFFIDALFFSDLIKNFFLAYYTKDEEKLIKNNAKIVYNYLNGWFIIDFFSSIPFNFITFLYCNHYDKKNIIFKKCNSYMKNDNGEFFLILKCFKALKTLKIWQRKKNKFITEITDKIADDILSDNILSIFIKIFFLLSGFHLMASLFIFIGRHSYPNWIFKQNFQQNDLLSLYIISVYYLTTTVSTVGYGDIQPNSYIEVIFQIIAITVGTVLYSWLVSSISNGIHKQSFASLNYEKECKILEEIRRTNNRMSYDIYLNIQKYLELKHFHQEKYDKNLLMNSLPYNLKNSLIFSMYNNVLNNFHIFKGISNSNFVIDVLNSFIPVSAKKNDILINENDKIESYIFIRDGRLSLEITINLDSAEESVNKYLSNDYLCFAEDIDNDAPNASMISKNISLNSIIDSHINFLGTKKSSFIVSTNIGQKKENIKKNIINLKIHDVHKNEEFGGFFMYTGRRSPFLVRVKTKIAELYVIKSTEYSKLIEQYPNVWNRIYKKKMYNIRQIKNVLIKTISQFCETKGIRIYGFYNDIIKNAVKACNKDIIPFKTLKKNIGINSFPTNKLKIQKNSNSSDEEKNNNKKETISIKKSTSPKLCLNYNKKIQRFKKTKTTKTKNSNKQEKTLVNFIKQTHLINSEMLDEFLDSQFDDNEIIKNIKININDSNASSNFTLKNMITKKHKHKHKQRKQSSVQTKIITNCKMDIPLKGITFNYSESDESIETVKIEEKNDNNLQSNEPNTIKALPQSLINILKMKIQYQKLLNQKENTESKVVNYQKESNIMDSGISVNNINNENCVKNNTLTSSNFNINSTINDFITNNNITNIDKIQSNCFYYNKNVKNSNQNIQMLNNISSGNSLQEKNKNSNNAFNINNLNNNNNNLLHNSSSITSNQELVNKKRINLVKNFSIRDSLAPFDTINSNFSHDIIVETNENNNDNNKIKIINNSRRPSKFKNVVNKKKLRVYNGCNITNNNFLLKLNDSLINGSFNFDCTNVESFEISASYDNINEMAGGIYIENYKFQKEIKKVIKTLKIQNKFKIPKEKNNSSNSQNQIIFKNKFIQESSYKDILKEFPNEYLKSVSLIIKPESNKIGNCQSLTNSIKKKEYFKANSIGKKEHLKIQKKNMSKKSVKSVKKILKCRNEKINKNNIEENNDTFLKLAISNNDTIAVNEMDDENNENKIGAKKKSSNAVLWKKKGINK